MTRSMRPGRSVLLPFEVAISIVLPPLAMILAWLDIVRRPDLPGPLRGYWAVLCLIPVLGPLLYLGIGGGRLF
jgi:hypothetical protein